MMIPGEFAGGLSTGIVIAFLSFSSAGLGAGEILTKETC